MPTYEYLCSLCKTNFDVVKSIKELDEVETCPACAAHETVRTISRTHFYGAADWDKAQYNPGLGIVTRNSKHAYREAKSRGLIEVGNEPAEKLLAAQEKEFSDAQDRAFNKSWEKMEYGLKKEMGKI
jgi:putative FmdB family regulatory protein